MSEITHLVSYNLYKTSDPQTLTRIQVFMIADCRNEVFYAIQDCTSKAIYTAGLDKMAILFFKNFYNSVNNFTNLLQ